MRLILSIAIAAIVLAGCADVHDKFAEVPTCKRSAGTNRSIALQVSGPGLRMNGGFVIPGRDLGGSGKLDRDWGKSPGCIRQERDERKPPKFYDLHKIGMAL